MAPKIHNPADLTPEARLAIERKQFDQLLPAMHVQYHRWQLECDFIYGDSPRGVNRATHDLDFDTSNAFETLWKEIYGYKIFRGEWASLITSDVADDSEARATMHPNLLEAYITMICHHVNEVRGDAKKMALEQDKGEEKNQRSRSPAKKPSNPIRVRSPPRTRAKVASLDKTARGRNKPISQSCKVISGEAFLQCYTDTKDESLDEEALDKLLENIDCTPENFRELDYLFIPIVENGHALLIGLAPKQKYTFFLDSESFSFPEPSKTWWGIGLMIIIHKLDPTIKFSEKNVPVVDRSKYWYLFGQYSKRSKTDDGSPDGPQQGDRHNCGIFALTSAFCLAFGYSLLCWEQSNKPGGRRDLDQWKKARIAFELETRGFSAEHDFDYDLLEIPTEEIKPVVRPLDDQISSESEVSDPESLHPCDDLTPPSDGEPMDEDQDQDEGEDDDYDMQEAFMIEGQDPDFGYVTDEGEEGSDGEVDERVERTTATARCN